MEKKEFHSDSKVIMPDGTVRRFDSFTAEERSAMCDRWLERIAKTIEEYVDQHPEQYWQVRDALLSVPGAELLYEERY